MEEKSKQPYSAAGYKTAEEFEHQLREKRKEHRDAKERTRNAKADVEAAVAAGEGGAQIVEPLDEALTNFITETIENHQASKYMLVLSGHGSGAVGDFLTSNKRFFGLTIPELRATLRRVQTHFEKKTELFSGKFDILGLDSCLMSMAEVAYEVREYVEYTVGTEGFEANAGWPYDRILSRLRSNSGILPRDFATAIVDEYIDYYRSDYTLAEVSTDISALDVGKIDHFVTALGGNGDGGL